ncbi:MAG: antitoxin MazE-like protein [Acetobacteraceae bacterium]
MALTRAERVERRRAKLRESGLRPVQLWVPDTRAPGFAAECRRQSWRIREAETVASLAEDAAWEAASVEAAATHEAG